MNERLLNVAGQCEATATSDLASKMMVDGGSGTLKELLLDAADCLRTYTESPQETADALSARMYGMDEGERLAIIQTLTSKYCEHCGRAHGPSYCQCWNDD